MIKYINIWKKKLDFFLFKKVSSNKLIFNIKVKSNKINYFLELKNIKGKNNFLWFGNWDNNKIDLSKYRKYSPSYNSVFQIYKENLDYTECEEYKIKSKLIQLGKSSGRGKDLNELDEYFKSLDALKDSLKTYGYKSQIELNNSTKVNDEIGVVIGSNWELIKLQDKFGGTHRFALCKIFNINEIVVSVKAIHQDLLSKENLNIILNDYDNSKIKSVLEKKILSKY